MDYIEVTNSTAQRHAPLVQRAGAVIASMGNTCRLRLVEGDADGKASVHGDDRTTISLFHGRTNRLDRLPTPHGGRRPHFALNYVDPAGEDALAALISCATLGGPVAADPDSLSVLALAERLAMSDIPVLIGGPTGTGKEVLSRYIHDSSPRRNGPFIAVNCAAMPEAMLEALLFGHTKGAFTGATSANEGFFRAADGGTLLLDEIAEMPLALQAKLLRALQEGEVVPIGATQPVRFDVRIIAAANRDLPTEVAQGRFRADLFYRLNVFPLALKPLRERPEDIAPLAFALAMRHTPAHRAVPWIGEEALHMLRSHGWPGNVRELENVIRRALLLAEGLGGSPSAEIGPEHIRFDCVAKLVDEPAASETAAVPAPVASMPEPTAATGRKLASIVQVSEAKAILETLAACGGSRIAAARQLGISERTLRYRLASLREAGMPVAAVGGGRR
ncbi:MULTISPECIES: sigma-54 interaction domain-containing protein [unclassified Novosphingobium]|uniref:sigma-54 interaction domain-containing protein n=1 Tax=unclassified Novosphingobium TaxID=2644732 RepID=UPI00086C1984|nr:MULTISPECIES: sigma 54-interacting transcriptional regulator [unclassified Novosphingobium]MBN9143219.1 sigma 54-interacting transcriptional regulator [Novosphingobium sp.]MDR6706307.1 two-component system response regulator FlrC [Novosphingobium sp. 1748]ODU82687.1 MAG: sigma-54-dependent Fis family transcriptional regulator [Novosphingobium sp. SCN 63-17]OJX89543.1 MAG: sigma-54-dependent Fis family transcriptional regulator [Novosphingobium sp. 63-713]